MGSDKCLIYFLMERDQLQRLWESIFRKDKKKFENLSKINFRNMQSGETDKSALAAHVWKEKQAIDHKPILLKQASNKQELANWEKILTAKKKDFIIKFENLPTDF